MLVISMTILRTFPQFIPLRHISYYIFKVHGEFLHFVCVHKHSYSISPLGICTALMVSKYILWLCIFIMAVYRHVFLTLQM